MDTTIDTDALLSADPDFAAVCDARRDDAIDLACAENY